MTVNGSPYRVRVAGKIVERTAVMKTIKVEKIEAATSILDLLDALPVQERSLIEHDAKIFRALLGEQTYRSGIFSGKSDYSDRSVRVYVADKTNLETVLGVDSPGYSRDHYPA